MFEENVIERTVAKAPLGERSKRDSVRLQALGDLYYLASRNKEIRQQPLGRVRLRLEPAVHHDFFTVFRKDGVPLAALTWAFLNPDAEIKVVNGQPLKTKEWLSGRRMWLMDVIILNGQGTASSTIRWFQKQLPQRVQTVRYVRRKLADNSSRIVEMYRADQTRWSVQLLNPNWIPQPRALGPQPKPRT